MITQEQLKELLHYNPDTGIFTWKRRPSNRVSVGDNAGHLNRDGYIDLTVNGFKQGAHRFAWLYIYGFLPLGHIDHINGNRSDNRIVNIRDGTQLENNKNKSKLKSNKSGVTGVY